MPKEPRFDALGWARLLRESSLTTTERAVGWALALRAGATGQCWPSVATLAGDTGLSESSVQRALRALKAGGWVEVRSARAGFTPDYQLTTCTGVTVTGVGVSHRHRGGVTVTGEGCHCDGGGVSHRHPKLVIEEQKEEQTEDARTAREAASFFEQEEEDEDWSQEMPGMGEVEDLGGQGKEGVFNWSEAVKTLAFKAEQLKGGKL